MMPGIKNYIYSKLKSYCIEILKSIHLNYEYIKKPEPKKPVVNND